MRPASLEAVVASGLCTGCGLCAGIGDGAVAMRLTGRGFLRPAVTRPLPPQRLRRILDACPGIAIRAEAAAAHPLWGPVLDLRRAHAADPALRFHGASGGAISALLAHLLAAGTVEFVLQIAADADAPLRNGPRRSFTAAEILERSGSRYAPAAPLADLDALLRAGRRFAVVGKPCDIAALRSYARIEPAVDALIPCMISFFCAGVPSLRGTQLLLERMGVDEAELARLRYRGCGWPGMMTAETRSGRVARMSYAESWGGELHRHLQFRCKICPDGTGELADLVAADAWATADGYPDFEERDGWSVVIARTPRGRALLRDGIAAGALVAEPLRPEALAAMQPHQVRRKRTLAARLAALAVLGRHRPRFRGLRLWRNACRGGLGLPRAFAATAVRVLQGRHRE